MGAGHVPVAPRSCRAVRISFCSNVVPVESKRFLECSKAVYGEAFLLEVMAELDEAEGVMEGRVADVSSARGKMQDHKVKIWSRVKSYGATRR